MVNSNYGKSLCKLEIVRQNILLLESVSTDLPILTLMEENSQETMFICFKGIMMSFWEISHGQLNLMNLLKWQDGTKRV